MNCWFHLPINLNHNNVLKLYAYIMKKMDVITVEVI